MRMDDRDNTMLRGQELYECVNAQLSRDRAIAHIERMNSWFRYTGTADSEAFVDDLINRLKGYGIPYEIVPYRAYASIPVTSCVRLENGEDIPSIADVYSGEALQLNGRLIYDRWGKLADITPQQAKERYDAFKGKIVLSYDDREDFPAEIARCGGLALIHINTSKGGYIHHNTMSPFWGTPNTRQMDMLALAPSVGISLEDGERLTEALEARDISVSMDVKMDTRVVNTRMVIVDIPGKSDKFVMIHGHYDSWYEGITDNAASDAILLELARAFYMNKDKLKRGVKIAWWSGHSDARYAGSTWYCDTHWDELNRRCVASINLDLTGCKCAEQIRARTTCMEGEDFTAELINEFTGAEVKPHIPMSRGADQSFWGVHVPIHIMFKYEPTDEKRVSPCPSGGPWWHTPQDTIDKLDVDIMMRDMRINAKAACLIANSDVLPVKPVDFVEDLEKRLTDICNEAPEGWDMQDVLISVRGVKTACERLEEHIKTNPDGDYDEILKKVAGELVRLVYTRGSQYDQDLSTAYAPCGVFSSCVKQARNMAGDPKELSARTEFIRACNRMKGQLDKVADIIGRELVS